jgi:hypothetical protein
VCKANNWLYWQVELVPRDCGTVVESIARGDVYEILQKVRLNVFQINNVGVLRSAFIESCEQQKINIRKVGDLFRDMRIRWNSSYDMVARFLLFKSVVQHLSKNIVHIEGLPAKRIIRFQKFALTEHDWEMVKNIGVYTPKLYIYRNKKELS